MPRSWSARFWHAFTWYTVLFKNLRVRKFDLARREMARATEGAIAALKRQGAPWQDNWFEVPRHRVDAVDSPFVRDLVRKAQPFVLEGAASGWQATQAWSLDHFEARFGDQLVTAKGDLMDAGVFERRPIRDVVADLRAGKPVYTGFAEEILLRNPELLQDIRREDILAMVGARDRRSSLVNFFRNGTISSLQLFLQGANACTTYHMTKFHNFFVELRGRKQWVLVDPAHSMGVDIQPSAAYYFITPQPLAPQDSPDDLYSYVPKQHTVLEPGDILFVPSYWWHDVRTWDSDHVMGLAIRSSDWVVDTLLLDFLLLFDVKTISFFYKAFIQGQALTDAEDAVVHIDADLKRLGVAARPAAPATAVRPN